ncbi:plasmid mobilization relaxosome protein MobC [Streptomyces sp. 769]|uniref:plasmid mobilization relaxosome protein MobC n=1 Tax=Streptomyces sp. 769 TaxID=1262452 RepID=UPI00193A452D|nr:plasmid mobilization relaxosome protein MobC [Streptomyces sp. 769]
MTNPNDPQPHAQGEAKTNSPSERASYPKSSTPVGSTTFETPAPGVAGADRHRGAPIRQEATEGGPHPEEDKTHPCHNPACAQSTPTKPSARNRTRKNSENKRVHLLATRFNDAEKSDVLAGAAACALTPSGFLAHATLRAARDLARTAAEVAGEREVIAELFALRRHLSQIGNNLNQVAKATNSGADVPHAKAVLDAVRKAARRVDAFTQHFLDTETRVG